MFYNTKLRALQSSVAITYPRYDEQYRGLEITAPSRKKRHDADAEGYAINGRAGSGPHKIALSRRRYPRSHGVISAVSRIFPRPCVRAAPVFEALFPDRAKYSREVTCVFRSGE